MSGPCIPIQYAMYRAWGDFEVTGVLNQGAANSAPVDSVRDTLLGAGWSLEIFSKLAQGDLFFLTSLPLIGSGITRIAMSFDDGESKRIFVMYDPSSGNPIPSGMIGDYLVIPVPEGDLVTVPGGGVINQSMENLASAASNNRFVWSRTSDTMLHVTATEAFTPGTFGNGKVANGQFGAAMLTGGGGWILDSALANNKTSIKAVVYGNDGDGMRIDVYLNNNLCARGLADLFGNRTYKIIANEYQFAVIDTSSPTKVLAMFACAPFVLPDFVDTLGYTGFVILDSSGTTRAYTDGVFSANPFRTLYWRYNSASPLTVSSGKTLGYGHEVMMWNSSNQPVLVGSIWDTWVESIHREFGPDGERTEYDGYSWMPLFSQIGPGFFSSVTSASSWLALPEGFR